MKASTFSSCATALLLLYVEFVAPAVVLVFGCHCCFYYFVFAVIVEIMMKFQAKSTTAITIDIIISKLYGANAIIIIFVFVLYCIVSPPLLSLPPSLLMSLALSLPPQLLSLLSLIFLPHHHHYTTLASPHHTTSSSPQHNTTSTKTRTKTTWRCSFSSAT